MPTCVICLDICLCRSQVCNCRVTKLRTSVQFLSFDFAGGCCLKSPHVYKTSWTSWQACCSGSPIWVAICKNSIIAASSWSDGYDGPGGMDDVFRISIFRECVILYGHELGPPEMGRRLFQSLVCAFWPFDLV